jgi:hypothetical protein
MAPEESLPPPPIVPPAAAEFRLSGVARGVFLFTGVILPAICFLLGYPDKPTWQSGQTMAYAELYLSHQGSMAFYPLLLYNMASMTLLVINPGQFIAKAWVRFGIYCGVVVALGFWGLFVSTSNDSPNQSIIEHFLAALFLSFLAVSIPWAILYGLYFTNDKIKKSLGINLIIALICIVFFPFVSVFSLACSTSWAVASYATMSFFMIRHRKERGFQFSLAQLLGAVTWFGAYCASWRVAYLIVLEEYAKLPTEPPQDCYLCTAAARGHRRFVKSEEIISAEGVAYRVNDQLRWFKAFELLLLAVCPRLHRLCRLVYDSVGPAMARTIEYPLFADAAYAALKPVEWFCRAMLFLAVRDTAACRRLYRGLPLVRRRK